MQPESNIGSLATSHTLVEGKNRTKQGDIIMGCSTTGPPWSVTEEL